MQDSNWLITKEKSIYCNYPSKVSTCIFFFFFFNWSIVVSFCCRQYNMQVRTMGPGTSNPALSLQTWTAGSRAHGPNLHAVPPKTAKRKHAVHSHSGLLCSHFKTHNNFILFDAMVNKVVSIIFVSECSLLVYRNAPNLFTNCIYCFIYLLFAKFTDEFFSYLMAPLGFSVYSIMSSSKNEFFFYLSSLGSFYFFFFPDCCGQDLQNYVE